MVMFHSYVSLPEGNFTPEDIFFVDGPFNQVLELPTWVCPQKVVPH